MFFLQLIPSFNALRTTVFAANKSTISPLPNELTSILGEEFNNVATVLESYLSSTLRYIASYPSAFVHILLLPLLPELTSEHLDLSITNDTYTAFC